MCQDLYRELAPRDTIEKMYVVEIANLAWELLRLWRCRTVVINAAFHDAVDALLYRFTEREEDHRARDETLKKLALAWFTDEKAKAQVTEILRNFNLDERAIEAEAIRESTDALEKLEEIDRLMRGSPRQNASADIRIPRCLASTALLLPPRSSTPTTSTFVQSLARSSHQRHDRWQVRAERPPIVETPARALAHGRRVASAGQAAIPIVTAFLPDCPHPAN